MAFRLVLAGFVLFSVSAYGEFLRISIDYSGEECASCAGTMTRTIGRLRGVTSVSVDPAKPVIAIELAEGNRVPLPEIRDAIKRVGFAPGEVRAIVRGSITNEESRRILKPTGLEQFYELSGAVPAPGIATLEGVIAPPPPGARETLQVKSTLSE